MWVLEVGTGYKVGTEGGYIAVKGYVQARAQDFEMGGYEGLCIESHTHFNDHKTNITGNHTLHLHQ